MVHSEVYLTCYDNLRAANPGSVSYLVCMPDGSCFEEAGHVLSGSEAADGCDRRVCSYGALCCSAFFDDGRMVASAVFVHS